MTDYKNLKLRASSNPHIRNGEDCLLYTSDAADEL